MPFCGLERKSNSNFSRQTVRYRDATRSNEVARRAKACQSNVGNEVVSEVRPIRQIENLKDSLQRRPLTDSKVLRDACV